MIEKGKSNNKQKHFEAAVSNGLSLNLSR